MELKSLFKGIADAIREKDGTADPIVASDFPERISSIPTSSPGAVLTKDVNFYDYDGTLLYSYTLAEAQALTALPEGPVHEGLIFQGWNWSLEKVKALTRAMNIGAVYITDDGKTRLKIHIWDTARSDVPLYISQTIANGVTIDWGDGSQAETLDGTGKVNTAHNYTATGDYTISLSVADRCKLGLGHSDDYVCVLGVGNSSEKVYTNLLQEVNIGQGVVTVNYYAFSYCQSLSSITIPDTITSIGMRAFSNCYSLSSIIIPDSVTYISTYAFSNCYSLSSIAIPDSLASMTGYMFYYCYSLSSVTIPDSTKSIGMFTFSNCYSLSSITIPDNITSIGMNAFYYCYSLSSVTIPDSVTRIESAAFSYCQSLSSITIPDNITRIDSGIFSACPALSGITIPDNVTTIDANAFASCTGIAEYHLKPAVPPALANVNAFKNIPSDCIIYVPAGSLEAYKTATNWSTYADHMQEE